MSCVSTGSLDADEKEAWRSLRKDLQSVGITPDLFNRHRPIILSTIQRHLTPDGGEDSPIAFPLEESSRWTDPAAGLPYEDLYSLPDLEHTQDAGSPALASASQSHSSSTLVSKIRQYLELSPKEKKQPEQLRQYLDLSSGQDFDRARATALKYIRQFNELSQDPGSDYANHVRQALQTVREGRKRSTRGKRSTAQPSMVLGDYNGSGISSHDKIEAGDILSIAPLAVDNQALHSASTDCPICKYDTEIPSISMLSDADGRNVLDDSESISIWPGYNITPSRHKSHCSYLTPQMGYDSLYPTSTKAQRPLTNLLDSSSFNIGSNAGDEVYFTSLTDPLYEGKPSRVVVPRTDGPSYFPPSYQPSQNKPPPQSNRPLSSNVLPQYKPVFYNPITEFPQPRYELSQYPPFQSKPLQYEPLQ